MIQDTTANNNALAQNADADTLAGNKPQANSVAVIVGSRASNSYSYSINGTANYADVIEEYAYYNGQLLGSANIKATTTPSLSKAVSELTDKDGTPKEVNSALSVGDYIKFELTSQVPMTTGFSKYSFDITDEPSSGLEYVSDIGHEPKAKVGSTKLTSVSETGTDVQVKKESDSMVHARFLKMLYTDETDPLHPVVKPSYNLGDAMTVTLWCKCNITTNQINKSWLYYSNSETNQPSTMGDTTTGSLGKVKGGFVQFKTNTITVQNYRYKTSTVWLTGNHYTVSDSDRNQLWFQISAMLIISPTPETKIKVMQPAMTVTDRTICSCIHLRCQQVGVVLKINQLDV